MDTPNLSYVNMVSICASEVLVLLEISYRLDVMGNTRSMKKLRELAVIESTGCSISFRFFTMGRLLSGVPAAALS
jgi:hypothetical protein